jgi:hypothetical protein
MAHSNREKIRESRGGKTKHQVGKISRQRNKSTFDAQARIKELDAYMRSLTEKKTPTVAGAPKPKSYDRKESTVERRKGVIQRLEVQLEDKTLPEDSVYRINKELETLKKRI